MITTPYRLIDEGGEQLLCFVDPVLRHRCECQTLSRTRMVHPSRDLRCRRRATSIWGSIFPLPAVIPASLLNTQCVSAFQVHQRSPPSLTYTSRPSASLRRSWSPTRPRRPPHTSRATLSPTHMHSASPRTQHTSLRPSVRISAPRERRTRLSAGSRRRSSLKTKRSRRVNERRKL